MRKIGGWGFMTGLALLLALPAGGAAQDAYGPEDLSEMPSIKSVDQAQRAIARAYPNTLRDAGISGRVQLRFVVGTDGSVDPATIEVVAATQVAFGQAAATAITEIEFEPGKKDGEAVRSRVVMPITFAAT